MKKCPFLEPTETKTGPLLRIWWILNDIVSNLFRRLIIPNFLHLNFPFPCGWNEKLQHERDNSQLGIEFGCYDEEEVWNIMRTTLRMLVRCAAHIFMAVTHNLPWNAKRNRTPWLFQVHTLILWKAKSIYGGGDWTAIANDAIFRPCKLQMRETEQTERNQERETRRWMLEWETVNGGTTWSDVDELFENMKNQIKSRIVWRRTKIQEKLALWTF